MYVLKIHVFLIYSAPHQPRLDWQMWFAALSSYQHNPWLVHMVYRLLIGQKEGMCSCCTASSCLPCSVYRKILFADLPALQSSLLHTHTMPSTMVSGENGNLMQTYSFSHYNYAKRGSDLNSLHTEIQFSIARLL